MAGSFWPSTNSSKTGLAGQNTKSPRGPTLAASRPPKPQSPHSATCWETTSCATSKPGRRTAPRPRANHKPRVRAARYDNAIGAPVAGGADCLVFGRCSVLSEAEVDGHADERGDVGVDVDRVVAI